LKNSEVIVVMYHEFGSRLAELLDRPVLYGPFGINETSAFILDLARLLGCEQTGEAFIAEEKQTVLAPIWDLWRGPQAEWFPTIRFGVVAAASYANGLKKFLAGEMGMQCLFSHTTEETDNTALRETLAQAQPQFFFGRIVDKIYLAELDAKTRFIPAGFPGPIVRRALGTPFMGHSGAVFLLQEIVNALYDMLFNFLPLNRKSDSAAPSPRKMEWNADAEALLNEAVKKAPFISQISFGRELKKKAEEQALRQGKEAVTAETVSLIL